jgi:hypothetical protein
MKDLPDPRFAKSEPLDVEPFRVEQTPGVRGCACPPGANLTCQADDCPRKPGTSAKGGASTSDLIMKGGQP